jgi:hypothetical protein
VSEAIDTTALGDVEVDALDGGKRRLGEAWAERTAVLAFVRHFG